MSSINKKEEVIRLIDDPNLVEFRTNISGWTGADNLYYGHGEDGERRARYGNATHKKCNCGEIYIKNSFCSPCSLKRSRDNFDKLEIVEWDGKSMMCLWQDDRFFSDMDEVFEYCEEEDIDIKELQLMHCENKFIFSHVNIDEINEEYCDQHGENGVSHFHPEIAKKVKELNDLLDNTKSKLWFGTNKRIKI